jgi:PAS domain S-box-containing protein
VDCHYLNSGFNALSYKNKIENFSLVSKFRDSRLLGISSCEENNFSKHSRILLGINWIAIFDGEQITKISDKFNLSYAGLNDQISVNFVNKEKIIFGSTSTLYIYSFVSKKLDKLILDTPTSDRGATSIFKDYEGNIWISSLRGIYKLTIIPFENYSKKTGLLEDEVCLVSCFNSGLKIFGHNYGITFETKASYNKIKFNDPLKNDANISRVLGGFHDIFNDVLYFVSLENGVGKLFNNGEIKWIKSNLARRYSFIYENQKKEIIVFTTNGIFKIVNNKLLLINSLNISMTRNALIINDSITAIASPRGISLLNGNKIIHLKTKDSEADNFFSILYTKDYGFLASSVKGLFKLKNDTLIKFNFNNEDITDPIYFIIQDSSKNIWLGTNNGVLKWDGKNLKRYNKNDGLAGNETNRAAGFVDSKGNVWIGTDEGVSMYTGNEPDYASFPPKVMLLDFKDHSNFRYSTNNNVSVDPDKNNLTFHYRGLSFLDEKRNSYQIKLSEVDGDYYNEFTTKATSARFNNLAPGDYVFSVRVKNSKGIWSNWANSSVITVKKFFYQELFFQLGVLGLFLFITYSLYNYIQQKKYTKQLEHAVDIRTKDLRETQDQLITSANRYKGIIESQSDLVVRLTEEGILTFVNDAYCSVFGKKQDELIGKSFVPLVHPDDLTSTFEELKNLKDYPYRGTIEQRGLTIDGYRWYSWEGYAIRDPLGQILEIQAVGRDITLQKEIESELEKRVTERTIELQSLISQSPLGILTFDSEGKLITFNKIANQMFEFLDEYIGSEQNYNLFKDEFLVKNNYADKLFNLDAPHGFLLTPPVLIDSVSNKIYSKLFNHFLVYRIYILKFDENNKTYVMLVDDVTEQQNTEEVSKRLLEEKIRISTIFKTIESERERFAKELHDGLGQLLTTAKLKLDIIKLKTDKSILEINDTVNLLINAGDEIRRIISDLKPSDVENFGLSSSIELLIERTRQAAGINIILAILTTTEFKNKNTEIIIYRIVQEALNNIVKHSNCKNAVIELSSSDSELQLNIIDDGVGLEITKLNEKIKSYGIHNIQERVTSLNGKVEIETKPGEGFKYHITIPI